MEKEFNLSEKAKLFSACRDCYLEEDIKEFIKRILECKCLICKKEEPCEHCSKIEDLNNKKWIKKIKKRAGDKLI